MKARLSLIAIPLMMGVAFAQASGSGSPSGQGQTQTAPSSTAGSQSGDKAVTGDKATTADKAMTGDKAGSQSNGKPAEMKTMTYKGTLVDFSCAGGTASTATAGTSTATQTAPADTAPAANSANRAAGDSSSCMASASTTQFGLKTDQGQTYRFDMVGNQRAQDEFKNNKHWSNNGANKPLKVKISGVVQGDKLIVSSIH